MKKDLKIFAKKKTSVIVVCVICAVVLICPFAVFATEYLPDTDPLVTLSYLKDVFAPSIKEEVKNEIAAEKAAEEQAPKEPETAVPVGYEILELSAGQKLVSLEGTVELIVRPGSQATVISDIPDNGLSDISEMKELLNGEAVGANHALIIPRNDGRGIVVTSDKAYVLVRGDYGIIE